MPIVGLNRKARPRDVCIGYAATLLARPSETFQAFERRLPADCDALLRLLIGEGCDSPTQREYLYRLEVLAEELRRVRNHLYKIWKG